MFILYILSTASIQNKNLTRNGAKTSTKNNLWPSLTAKNRIHPGNRQAGRMIYLMGPQINRKCTDWMDWIKQPKNTVTFHRIGWSVLVSILTDRFHFLAFDRQIPPICSSFDSEQEPALYILRPHEPMLHFLTAQQFSSKSLRLIDVVDRQAPLYVHQEHKEPELV